MIVALSLHVVGFAMAVLSLAYIGGLEIIKGLTQDFDEHPLLSEC
jgi:hypothetical protein